MRRILLLLLLGLTVLVAVGVGTALGIHWAGVTNGMTMTVNGETIEGSMIAAGIGGLVAFVAGMVCIVVAAALASVAIIVPVALVLALFALAIAIVAGLSPLLVPVLLIVGVCMLVTRRAKRRASASAVGATPMPSAPLS